MSAHGGTSKRRPTTSGSENHSRTALLNAQQVANRGSVPTSKGGSQYSTVLPPIPAPRCPFEQVSQVLRSKRFTSTSATGIEPATTGSTVRGNSSTSLRKSEKQGGACPKLGQTGIELFSRRQHTLARLYARMLPAVRTIGKHACNSQAAAPVTTTAHEKLADCAIEGVKLL